MRWLLRDHGYDREGEADVVIGDPERGILVIEVKAGEIRRDATASVDARTPASRAVRAGRATAARARPQAPRAARLAGRPRARSPARPSPSPTSSSIDARAARPARPGRRRRADRRPVDLRRHRRRSARARRASSTARSSCGAARPATRPPGQAGIDLLVATMTEPFELRLDAPQRDRRRRARGRAADRRASTTLLNMLRGAASCLDRRRGRDRQDDARRREGPAARARGLRTLLVCFNSPLAAMLAAEVGGRRAGDRAASTSRRSTSCARTSGARPACCRRDPRRCRRTGGTGRCRGALDDAIAQARAALPRDRRRRGPGLRRRAGCCRSSELLFDGREDVLYVFHDPAQAIYRDDAVGGLGLPEFPLDMNCRNAQPIHDARRAARRGAGWRRDALRTDGRPPELIEADGEAGHARGAAEASSTGCGSTRRSRPGTSRC